eukprot:1072990-Pyramimonas_sp.AAC.1
MLSAPQWMLSAPQWILRARRTVFAFSAFRAHPRNIGGRRGDAYQPTHMHPLRNGSVSYKRVEFSSDKRSC